MARMSEVKADNANENKDQTTLPKIIDRSPAGLVDALCKRIEKALASFWQQSALNPEDFHSPYIHAQYLPAGLTAAEKPDQSKDYPLVQVICASGVVSDFHEAKNGSEINIQIYFGGFRDSPDNQGWRIPSGMLWRVMQDLCGNKVENGYILETPIKWSNISSKNPPFYTASLDTKWKGSPPAIETPFEGVAAPGVGSSEEKFGNS